MLCPYDGSELVSSGDRTHEMNAENGAGGKRALLKAGTNVGGYEVRRKIGEGGMGEVYAGVHPVIGKNVAIKVLLPNWSRDQTMALRFIQEARAVNAIGHENIVDIFAFGELPTGELYLVMELLVGKSLGDYATAKKKLEPKDAAEILIHVCDALSAAHAKGIVHRDLKPDNVFLVDGKGGRRLVKLLDFGIAKLTAVGNTRSTQSGMAVGTPLYMSPEQCMGRDVDGRADVYAVGVMMFELLTGDLPFSGRGQLEVMNAHLQNTPPDPSLKGVPSQLSRLILECLRKTPADRPSAQQLGERLTKMLAEGFGDETLKLEAKPELASTAVTDDTVKKAPKPGTSGKHRVKKMAPAANFLEQRKNKNGRPKVYAAEALKPAKPDPAVYDVIDELELSARNLGVDRGWKTPAPVKPKTPTPARKTQPRVVASKTSYSYYVVGFLTLWGAVGFLWYQHHMSERVANASTSEQAAPPRVESFAKPSSRGAGRVRLHASVDQATFEVDGKVLAEKTNTLDATLPEGAHTVVVSARGYQPTSETILVSADRLTSKALKLSKKR